MAKLVVIARIYTDTHGLTSFIIKGARSNSKSQKAPLLQKGTLLEIDYSYQSNKQLHYLKEIKRAYTYQSIPFDTTKSALMLFLIELVSATTIEHESNMEQFEYIFEQLVLLDEIKPTPLFHLTICG
jgi:DNA repair protein RecO (recombination protein O)